MEISFVVKRRLEQLKLEQRDLAKAAQVTDSYISQLLTGKKAPPAPSRTDIYEKMERFLRLPAGRLSLLAHLQRREALKKRLEEPLLPLFKEVRESILRKCHPETVDEIRSIFERQPFGDLERLVTQKLLDVVKGVVSAELQNEEWLRKVAKPGEKSTEQVRVTALEFLDTDILDVSAEQCIDFLEPLIEAWDLDLKTFDMEVVLDRELVSRPVRKFGFVERQSESGHLQEPGLEEFLRDPSLSRDVTAEEVEFLRMLRTPGKRPTPLYYYRELQNFRDPIHFHRAGKVTSGNP
jgi:transcriptional regulator with XRE-family HTH domain